MTDPTTRLTNFYNALDQIKAIATLHYLGGAFDPEHMRTLAIIAADALNGREIPPMGEVTDEVRQKCIEVAEEYARWVDCCSSCERNIDTDGHHPTCPYWKADQ